MSNASKRPYFAVIASSLLLGLGACSSDISSGGGSDGEGEVCTTEGQTRCSGNSYQECSDGTYSNLSICAGTTTCSDTLGCVACAPEAGGVCVGDEVFSCNTDGTLGNSLIECDPGQCSNGSCGGGDDTCTAGGTELVYVIDDAYNLLSFDPEAIGTSDPFTLIGRPSCPAGAALQGGGTATPFSMSVDRDGIAWVLYNSGEIFHVSTSDANCQATGWTVGSSGFELFGMGFVSDAAGSNEETLYISGGAADDLVNGNLGTINKNSFAASVIGSLPNAEQSPELTGTGEAKLFAYFPGSLNSFVANLDKTNATRGESWNTTALDGGATAWAFAQWGGNFYIFATDAGGNSVYELNPATGQTQTVIPNSSYRVVGSGVSTCAPTQID